MSPRFKNFFQNFFFKIFFSKFFFQNFFLKFFFFIYLDICIPKLYVSGVTNDCVNTCVISLFNARPISYVTSPLIIFFNSLDNGNAKPFVTSDEILFDIVRAIDDDIVVSKSNFIRVISYVDNKISERANVSRKKF